MKKFLLPIGIIAIMILVGFFAYQTILNYRELLKGEEVPQVEEEIKEENEILPTISISPALEKKSIAMIIPFENFRDEEYFALRQIFFASGAEVKTVSIDISSEDLNSESFDALVFVKSYEMAEESASQGKTLALISEKVIMAADFSSFEEFAMKIVEVLAKQ